MYNGYLGLIPSRVEGEAPHSSAHTQPRHPPQHRPDSIRRISLKNHRIAVMIRDTHNVIIRIRKKALLSEIRHSK